MPVDGPGQRNRGTPAGDSQSAKTNMGQKMVLLYQRISLVNSSSRHVDDDFKLTDKGLPTVVRQQCKAVDGCDDPDNGVVNYAPLRIGRPYIMGNGQEQHPDSRYEHGARKTSSRITITYKRRRRTPAGDSQSAKTKLGLKRSLVHQKISLPDSSSSRHIDDEDNFAPTGEELAIVIGQSMAVDDCDGTDAEIFYPHLGIVRPEIEENERCPGFPHKQGVTETSTRFTKTYTRRRGRPAGSKSAKRNMEQKPALFDSSGSSSRSGGKSDKDDNLEPSDEDGKFEACDKDGDYEPSENDDDFEPTFREYNRNAAGYLLGLLCLPPCLKTNGI